jgi:hypothetical protein
MNFPEGVPEEVRKEFEESMDRYEADLTVAALEAIGGKRVNYRKHAFEHYKQFGQIICVHCGFGILEVLEVAHLDADRSNNDVTNLAILCPTCHKMHDIDLISSGTIREMRDRTRTVVWGKRMKDAGAKAAASRQKTLQKQKRQIAANKAVATRRDNAAKITS